jgi:hypothetical protein
MTGDITSKRVLYIKGGLFLVLGGVATAIALARYPDWQLAALMAIAIWAFCRAYYFAFYVIEHYVDPRFKFAGLGSFVRYLCQRDREKRRE